MSKKIMSCLLCGIWLFSAGAVIGQAGEVTGLTPKSSISSTKKVDSLKVIVPVTPEQKARMDESYRLDKAARAAMDAGNYEEAEDDARQSMAVGPDSGLAEQYLAASLYLQGKTPEALAAYKVMVDEGDTDPRTLLPFSLLLLQTGHWAQAVAAYNMAQWGAGDANLLYADTHFSPAKPQPKELEAALHIALGLDTGWEGYTNDARRPLQTLIQFRRALTLEPNSALANYYYGYGLQDAGRSADAKAAFAKAAALGGPDVKAAVEKALLP